MPTQPGYPFVDWHIRGVGDDALYKSTFYITLHLHYNEYQPKGGDTLRLGSGRYKTV